MWTLRFIGVDPLAGKYANLTSYNNASNSPIKSLDIDGMQNPDEGGSKGSNDTTPKKEEGAEKDSGNIEKKTGSYEDFKADAETEASKKEHNISMT